MENPEEVRIYQVRYSSMRSNADINFSSLRTHRYCDPLAKYNLLESIFLR